MKKSCFKALFLALLLSLVAVISVSAETLALDNNGIPIQFGRYWTCVSDSIPVQSHSSIACAASSGVRLPFAINILSSESSPIVG